MTCPGKPHDGHTEDNQLCPIEWADKEVCYCTGVAHELGVLSLCVYSQSMKEKAHKAREGLRIVETDLLPPGPIVVMVRGRKNGKVSAMEGDLVGNCRCRQVFYANSNGQETLPHKPGQYEECTYHVRFDGPPAAHVLPENAVSFTQNSSQSTEPDRVTFRDEGRILLGGPEGVRRRHPDAFAAGIDFGYYRTCCGTTPGSPHWKGCGTYFFADGQTVIKPDFYTTELWGPARLRIREDTVASDRTFENETRLH